MSTEQETNIKTRAGNMSDARVGITGCAWSGCQGAVTPLQREVHAGRVRVGSLRKMCSLYAEKSLKITVAF